MTIKEGDTVDDPGGFWDGAPVLSVYSRAQAIEDGTLVDLSDTSEKAEAGFVWPVACTREVWHLIEPTAEEASFGQDWKGRLWDVLWMAKHAIRREPEQESGTALRFQVIFLVCKDRDGVTRRHEETVTLKLVAGPGDDAEPVMTLMLPNQD